MIEGSIYPNVRALPTTTVSRGTIRSCRTTTARGDRSRIYKTPDGGKGWVEQFRNADPKAFYDDIAFWNRTTGVAIGDPVDGRFTVIRTTDGGRTWTPIEREGYDAVRVAGNTAWASGAGGRIGKLAPLR
jgi:photosystem II stability/assembly factor-like uncharacterized protein